MWKWGGGDRAPAIIKLVGTQNSPLGAIRASRPGILYGFVAGRCRRIEAGMLRQKAALGKNQSGQSFLSGHALF